MSLLGPVLTVIITTAVFFAILKLFLYLHKKSEQEKYLKKHGKPKSDLPPKKGPDEELDNLLFSLINGNKTSGEVVNALLDKGYTMKDIHLAYERFSLKNPQESKKHKHL